MILGYCFFLLHFILGDVGNFNLLEVVVVGFIQFLKNKGRILFAFFLFETFLVVLKQFLVEIDVGL